MHNWKSDLKQHISPLLVLFPHLETGDHSNAPFEGRCEASVNPSVSRAVSTRTHTAGRKAYIYYLLQYSEFSVPK